MGALACPLSLIDAKLLRLSAKEMKGCRGLIASTIICDISHSFAAIALQLLLFSYVNHAFCGKPAAAFLPPSAGGRDDEGTSCTKMRDTLLPTQFEKKELQASKLQRLPVQGHGRRLRNAGALGSTPPKCIAKCSRCTPCMPIRVPIQPGRPKVGLMEYYPEAWRCKCKNKLYMP